MLTQNQDFDVVVVGAGHNGLVASTFLARAGLRVLIIEEKGTIGGAVRTERPFPKAPNLATSTGAYLLGVMPPEVIERTGAKIRLIRRNPHYFLPTTDHRYILFGSDQKAMKDQFFKFFSESDWKANEALTTEISQIREDLAPSWLDEPLSVTETAERYLRPELREVFVNLVTRPVEEYLQRFEFKSELLVAMYAVTDGFSGLSGSFGTPKTGMNFLVHNMCRLPGSDGTFMIVEGGMGAVTREFARLATEAGAEILTGKGVSKITVHQNHATGVVLEDGREIKAQVVLSNADPFRMQKLVGTQNLPMEFNTKVENWKRPGTTMKVNLALDRLPTFKCLPQNHGQHNATIHLLPDERGILQSIRQGFEKVQKGELADFPTIEWYIHTQADPSLRDSQGNHNSAFFVQWVPFELKGSTWEREEERYVQHLLNIADEFAPGFSKSVVDKFVLTPPKIESYFGMSHGHIHHVDNTFGMNERMPYKTPIEGLYSCSAGCHPAGSVIGAAGHNAAQAMMRDLGVRLRSTT
ncbi:MAG: NAD(P)/FAD-dependent oxidoreductase [Bdellovibrio sp.]|nr:NAD(P)/FAD-dependent oxidoreductase [Bdellovibrio sp.]